MGIVLSALLLALSYAPATPPAVGDRAPAFRVQTLDKEKVTLAPLLKQGPVVLVILRGYPGYQCPFCTQQVASYLAKAGGFTERKATVVLVYPGPAEGLDKYAGEFIAGKDVPQNFRFTLDPGYKLTEKYGLRWDAPRETAYPSTFVITRDGIITYAKISHTHGDRAPVADVLGALDKESATKQ